VCQLAVPALVIVSAVLDAAACARRMAAAIGDRQMLPWHTQLTRVGRLDGGGMGAAAGIAAG
jgi:hypothetical protein